MRAILASLVVLFSFLALSSPAAVANVKDFEFRRGMVLGMFHSNPHISYRTDVEEIYELGCDSISLSFVLFQDDYDSNTIYAKDDRTAPDYRIRETILLAREHGMKVMLFPYLLLDNPSEGKWRGAIAPTDREAWWKSYNEKMVHYAEIAEACGVESFSIGSELSSMDMTRDLQHWRDLIKQIRSVFSGMITYTANWDHRDIPFWDDVDYLAVSCYFEIAKTRNPTLEDLITGWKPYKKDLDEWYARTAKGRPMIFAEIGYPSIDGGAMHPWDYTKPDPADPQEQFLCYEAFRKTWENCPYLGGVYFYAWFEKGGPQDRSYTPKGKPALEVIRSWYAKSASSPTTDTLALQAVTN